MTSQKAPTHPRIHHQHMPIRRLFHLVRLFYFWIYLNFNILKKHDRAMVEVAVVAIHRARPNHRRSLAVPAHHHHPSQARNRARRHHRRITRRTQCHDDMMI